MSIRRVNCPACNTVANVPVTMTNIKCPGCGHVWNVNNPNAVASKPSPKAGADDQHSNGGNAAVMAAVAGAVVVLAIAGIVLVLFLPSSDKPAQPEPSKSDLAAEPVVVETPPSFREVDLPESTRQQIYSDYRRMAKSSIEKKLKIPKNSVARTSVEGMLQKTVNREITHFALLHNITEDDVMQIVAEGDAKQWPGYKKPEKPAASKE